MGEGTVVSFAGASHEEDARLLFASAGMLRLASNARESKMSSELRIDLLASLLHCLLSLAHGILVMDVLDGVNLRTGYVLPHCLL